MASSISRSSIATRPTRTETSSSSPLSPVSNRASPSPARRPARPRRPSSIPISARPTSSRPTARPTPRPRSIRRSSTPSSAPAARSARDKLDVIWLETDPRRYSTSGDSLPDGWKLQHNLDPFDDGVIGHYNLHTGQVITSTDNGADRRSGRRRPDEPGRIPQRLRSARRGQAAAATAGLDHDRPRRDHHLRRGGQQTRIHRLERE